MWHDGEIDMEELEARLYSQVYHSNEEEIPVCKANVLQETLPSKPQKPRYFDGNEMQPLPYAASGIHRVYQRHSNDPPAYFQAPQNISSGYPESSNFYDQPLFTYPAVNNIVILPQPPTHIFATPPAITKPRSKRTIKRKERKKRQREKWKAIKMKQKKQEEDLKPVDVEIINISESDASDCEIKETQGRPIVLSSDDEADVIKKPSGIKSESKSEDFTSVNKELDLKEIVPNEFENGGEEDDDVVLVEPEIEVLSICDESPEANSFEEGDLVVPAEVMDTPESTNDFLDNSFNSTQNSVDVSNQKMSVNDFESDSNFSASDFDGPSPRGGIFIVTPTKDSLSELNLDSFTNYIASKASTSIASILTPLKNSPGNSALNNKWKSPSPMNSSDSSSESDYDDKVRLIENRKAKSKNKSASSGSDDCVINEPCGGLTKGNVSLPNLSPITSDEETKLNKNSSEIKQKKTHKKKVEKRKSAEDSEGLVKKPKRSDVNQEPTNFFSSSDSEIEVVNIDNKTPVEFDVELLNIGSSSTPKKQRVEKTKSKSFANYWTEDMEKFYRESWGHEQFDVEQEQQAMSDDPKMWKIINKDEAHYKLLPKGPRCFRCREFGHRAHNCNKTFPVPKCILCAGSGHLEARCPNKMCTSCGRRSHYSTTFCSRCANSRHVTCTICHMQGHSSSNCTDLWRRYHLTRANGPLSQPTDPNLKASKDRWCSGCATRGHFEFNCNYYNRSHAPVDPVIRSYENVYEKDQQTTEGYYQPPNQVSPWLPINCQPNTYQERYGPNFVQNPGTNQNFYQQFPVFQSIPSIFDLRFNNVFYTNPELMGTNRGGGGGIEDNSPNTSEFKKNLMAEIVPEISPLLEDENTYRTDFVKLKYSNKVDRLLYHDAFGFLKKLSQETKVKMKIIKRKKRKRLSYWCMLQGPQDKLPEVKESIKDHFEAESFNAMDVFQGRDFKLPILQENIAKLDNHYIDWSKIANGLYKKINQMKKKSGENPDTSKALKARYVALNSILIGKVGFVGGYKHMKILREGVANVKKYPEKILIDSYNHVFKNQNNFDEKYICGLLRLSSHESSKKYIHNLFQTGCSICKNKNMKEDLHKLTYLYKTVVSSMYDGKDIEKFKSFYYTIKGKGEK